MINFLNKTTKSTFIAFMLLTFMFAAPAFAAEYAVIVNAENTTSPENAKTEVKNIYMKKRTTWSNGAPAEPFARPAGDPVQKAFLSKVLELSQAGLDEYWAAEKSKTGEAAPREVGSERILLRQIGRKPGALAVVSADTDLPEDVKILFKF